MARPLTIDIVTADSDLGRGVLLGAIRHFRAAGAFRLVHHWTNLPGGSLGRALRGDAILAQVGGPNTLARLARLGRPVVNLSSRTEPQPFPRVAADPAAIAGLALGHFAERGHGAIAWVGIPGHGYSDARRDALLDEAARRRLPCLPWSGDPADAPSLRRFLASLAPPVALLACNDAAARRVIDAARALGLRIPEDLAVLGVDNDEVECELAPVPLSSIDPDHRAVGAEGARQLLALAEGRKIPTVSHVRPRGVVERESTRHLAFADRLVADALRFAASRAGHPVSVKEIVEHLGVSRRSLERRFVAALGCRPLEELHRRRFARAERLLRDTSLPAQDVAAAAGYGDARLLHEDVRRRAGTTPLGLRARLREG